MSSATLILFLAIAFAVTLLTRKLFVAKNRRDCLQKASRVFTWNEVERHPHDIAHIVQTNFAYGTELWVFAEEANDLDLRLSAFKSAILILPRPSPTHVERFCREHGIKLI